MKGGIYSDQRCRLCGGSFKDNGKTGLFCPEHPDQFATRFVIRFGDITNRFRDYEDALQVLGGYRFETRKGTFDKRDYRKHKPLGFANLASQWLRYRKGEVRCYRNLKNHLVVAADFFRNQNIKSIDYGDLEDFVHSLPEKLTDKTKANYLTTLHSFFVWCKKRHRINLPEFPVIKYELGWRNVVDKATQGAIIDEIRRISWDVNPKIWVGIKWLATYYEIRPSELIRIKEKDISYDLRTLQIRHTKTGGSRIILLLEHDLEIASSFGPAFPSLFFFRHIKGYGGVQAGTRFGKDYLWKWWTRACESLGIQGVDLYGGTRHSTVRELARIYTPEQIKHGGWKTNKAFDRYLGPIDQERKREIYKSTLGDYSSNRNTHTLGG